MTVGNLAPASRLRVRRNWNQDSVCQSGPDNVRSARYRTAITVCDFSTNQVARDPGCRSSAVWAGGGSLRVLDIPQRCYRPQVRAYWDVSLGQLHSIELNCDFGRLCGAGRLNIYHAADQLRAGVDPASIRKGNVLHEAR
jgi:hypothetical protein